jgi:8-oxo-dGTP pyrophosphatase MutT (NUDIX family)
MRFLGGYYVFPGGTVHGDDYSAQVLDRCRGLTAVEARRILGSSSHTAREALGHWVAVVRELFEEVGILLCVDESGANLGLPDTLKKQSLDDKRRAIVQRKLDFGAFLASENLFCDLSRLAYLDHWVTPEIYSMRFDTRFYIALLPNSQTALQHSEEVTHSLWINPDDALTRMDRRDFPILPPTTTVLRQLGQLSSWDRLRAKFNLH